MPPATRTLQTADDRREAVLRAAIEVIAHRGIAAAPTAEVARRAGISHAYLFRLFPTKNELAVAVVERCNRRVHDAFAEAAARVPRADKLAAMGQAYGRLLEDRELLLVQLHSHAAAVEDEAIRSAARHGFARLVELVERETGADAATVGRFFATGMLMNVMVALDAPATGAHWAEVLTTYHRVADSS